MKFGLFYELSTPRPFNTQNQRAVFENALEQIRLADVTSVERSDHAERDFQGVLLMGCVFSTASAILFVGVLGYGMRERFLLGSFIILVLGLISLYEAATATTFRFVQLRISLKDGETVYTTAKAADAAALELVLAERA